MLVAMVTAPLRPACATIAASRSWYLAFRTTCGTLGGRLSSFESISLFSIETVPTSTGWPRSLGLADLLDDRVPLLLGRAVDEVGPVVADHRLVGRDDDDVELVDLVELGRLGVGRAGHARELLVHAEVVLEGDRGEGLVLALDLDALLGLDGLVQAVRPAPAGHHAAGELVDDDDLAVLDQVVDVALVEGVGAQRLVDAVEDLHVLGVVEVAHAEELLDLLDALVGEARLVGLLVDQEVAGGALLAVALVDLLALDEAGDDAVDAVVLVGRLLGRAGDDERRAGLVDEDRVDLVDDGVVVPALHHRLQVELHVVAQVVEAELVVGAVGDVAGIGVLALGVGHVVLDHADGEAEEAVDLAHPLGVAAGQVVVDGDDVDALALQARSGRRAGSPPASCPRRSSSRRSGRGGARCRRSAGRRRAACGPTARRPRGRPRRPRTRMSSRVSPAASWARNSPVLARSSSSVSALIRGSSSLMAATIGSILFTSRSCGAAEDLGQDRVDHRGLAKGLGERLAVELERQRLQPPV